MTTLASSVELAITPLTGLTGAEDRCDPLAESTVAAILDALVEHKVIFFSGQNLSSEEHLAFAAQCGEITEAHPISRRNQGHPGLHEIDSSKIRDASTGRHNPLKKPHRAGWYTDVTFMETPPVGSILNALAIPERGGNTDFANTEAAYEGLSAPVQQFLDGLVAMHDGEESFGEGLRKDGFAEWDGVRFTEFTPVEHPLVRTHPVSGKKSLVVNPEFTSHSKGLSRRESDGILDLLYQHMINQHMINQKYLVRYNWTTGDLGFWDNRATMHFVVVDYGTQHRLVQRVTLKGERPC
jgi:alpha-ketoglutarate-dependent taurine dioxygenase